MSRVDARARSPDLRLLLLGSSAWLAVALTLVGPAWMVVALGAATVAAWAATRRIAIVAVALAFVAGAVVAGVHEHAADGSPVRDLARRQTATQAVVEVRTPGTIVRGRSGERQRFEATLVEFTARARRFRGGGRIVVVLEAGERFPVGTRMRLHGLLLPAGAPDATALLVGRGPPEQLSGPGLLDRAVNEVRGAVRAAVANRHTGAAALVPALVDGDEGGGGGTDTFAADFRIAGMTHLLAVSGTNLTIILGGVLFLARWCGVRSFGLALVGLLGVVGFVLLAGSEPSVLRAAAMGTVGLVALGRAGRGNGVRALGLAVLVLVLLAPGLAVSLGFVLSVTATAGILLLAPGLRDALGRWLPAWAAVAIAVPVAAQVACTPVVVAFSGQVSLVAIAANIVAAPFVAPATVLGLLGGLAALVSLPVGRVIAAPACWCADAIIAIARRAADLPVSAIDGVVTPAGITVVTAATLLLWCTLPWILRRRGRALLAAAVLTVAVLVPLPTPGWPPPGWVLVACDIGQGDALVLRAGPHSGVVIDAGPDPRLVDHCLRRLGIRSVPVLVLTHFHADHVDGLPGVLDGRRVGRIDVSPVADPASGERAVREAAAGRSIPVHVVTPGERTDVGTLDWQVLGPVREHPESASPPNDGSVVLLVESAGLRILLLGDAEPPAQADLRRTWPGLRADVLKVGHHGSARQDESLTRGLGARLAVISAGRDNDYGHPAPAALALLMRAGMRVLRTDRDGDVAVTVDSDGRLGTVTHRRRP